MTDTTIFEPDSKMQKMAQNATLQVAARVVMVAGRRLTNKPA